MYTDQAKASDPVNSPSHYTAGGIEVIDFIEAKNLGYHRGNCVKYVCRAGIKDPEKELEDIKKALWYLNRYKANLEKEIIAKNPPAPNAKTAH